MMFASQHAGCPSTQGGTLVFHCVQDSAGSQLAHSLENHFDSFTTSVQVKVPLCYPSFPFHPRTSHLSAATQVHL
jgi:hypothetical protein